MNQAKINITLFREYETQKLVTCRQHDNSELLIWNYTPSVQYSRKWDDVTMMCRGLITKLDGTIVARPFKKFFNYGEVWDGHGDGITVKKADIPEGGFSVTEKMDGSLGISYYDGKNWAIATRGSFYSDQAIKGTEILQQYISTCSTHFEAGLTYLFEIIYPSNRIVVDYGTEEKLVLLAIIDTATGEEHDISLSNHIHKVKSYGDMETFEHLFDDNQNNREGFVIRYADGTRLKLKFDEYVRLHKVITGVSKKTIWELLSANQPLDELLELVPDEFYDWVKETQKELEQQYTLIHTQASLLAGSVLSLETRKDQAKTITTSSAPKAVQSCAFKMLDKRDTEISSIIWKSIKPKYELPFKEEI